MKKLGYLMAMLLCMSACKPAAQKNEKPILMVTIEPLRYFAEAVAGDRYEVVSMVPKGVSPETYDPTPQQMIDLNQSAAYLRIGHIGFEEVWMDRLSENLPDLKIYDMSEGVDWIHEESHPNDGHHHHGVEPHIWNSAVNAEIIAENVYNALCKMDEASQPFYKHRLDSLKQVISATDSLVRDFLCQNADSTFLIYHPSLSYYAREYGLKQICIEDEGKEPSPAHLKELMETCKEHGVNVLFLQKEFSMDSALLIADELGLRIVPINPLSYQWQDEMLKVARTLTEH